MTGEAIVSADTQSALLLCAPLWKRSKDGPSPLTPAEYNELTSALVAYDLRPSDLLRPNAPLSLVSLLTHLPPKVRERVTAERVARLLERGGQLALALSHWTSAGIWIVGRADESYPSRYKRKLGRSSPPIVYGVGPSALLERGGLAVVGSRKPDELSERYTASVGRWAAGANVQVVSGAARGVDEGSMLACVGAGGTALGVVAESLLKLSTRRDFREAILAERLTLISSFDPDAGFSVPNAMGRNRWIYALADRALVVACREGSGGTWTGAVEALKRGVSVYVKTGNPERPGNDALVAKGAVPAPDDLSALWGDAAASAQPALEPVSKLPSDDDVYALVVPTLLRILQKKMNAKDLAGRAGLTKSQVDAWLKRLIAEGRVDKEKTMYRVAKPNLFEAETASSEEKRRAKLKYNVAERYRADY